MFVLIAGGGRTGAQLAEFLYQQGHDVHVIENREDVLKRLHHTLPTEVVYEGIATDPAVLEQAGIQRAQVMAAVTADDANNLVLCYIARQSYNVPRTIGRINDPRNSWLFENKDLFHVDVALNQPAILANMIEEEMSLGDMMTLVKLRRGKYSLVEEKIPEGAKAVGRAVQDLDLPAHCVIAAIIRQGSIQMPRGSTTFEVGDEVLAVTDREGAVQLADLFARPGAKPIPTME